MHIVGQTRRFTNVSAGTVVKAGRGFYSHVGMLTGYNIAGQRLVLSHSPKGIVEEPIDVFAEGNFVYAEGYLGKLNPSEVLVRARSQRGATYSLLGRNCEHFVRFAHGVAIESPQLQGWTLALTLVFLLTRA